MRERRVIYFLAHSVLVLIGVIVTMAGAARDEDWLKSLLISVGTSIVATGLCGMVIWIYFANSERNLAFLDVISSAGVAWIYPSRAAQIRGEYEERLESARSNIDILGFGLKDFKRDYLPELGRLSSRAKIRILLLDPDSPYCAQRDLEEEQSPGVISDEIREFLRGYHERYAQQQVRIELRLYRSLPQVNIFRIDDEIFWGPYLTGRASGNTFTMRVRRGGYAFEGLMSHFESVWRDFTHQPESQENAG
jgi:energy-converting hydrogenase Eha subunit E